MTSFRHKHVLVTGANGFIGAHLVAQLIAQGADVTCLVRASSDRWRFDALGIAPRTIVCDLNDKVQLDAWLRPMELDVVFHLATERDFERIAIADARGRSACSGVEVMQAVARSNRLPRFVSVGSSAEIPDPLTGIPSCMHGKSKGRELQELRALARKLNIAYTPTRTHYVYGPLQSPGKLVPVAINAALEGLSLSLTGPDIRKRFIFVLDLVDALLEVADLPATDGDVRLITSAQQVSNIEVVEHVARLVGKPITIKSNDFSPREFDRTDWSLSQAGTPLSGWQAKTSLEDGLRACINWETEAYV